MISMSQTGIQLQRTHPHTPTAEQPHTLSTCTHPHRSRRYLWKRGKLGKHIHNCRLQQMGCLLMGDRWRVCVCSLSSNLCFCRAPFLSVWPHAFVCLPSPHFYKAHSHLYSPVWAPIVFCALRLCVGVCRARSFVGAQPGYGLGAAGGIRDYFLAGKRISRAQGTAWPRLIFLSTASVIPQSLHVRELGPHSELRLGLTKAHKHTKIECTKKGEKREATKGTKGQNGESYGREMRKLRKK